jgi:hypothetical protein
MTRRSALGHLYNEQRRFPATEKHKVGTWYATATGSTTNNADDPPATSDFSFTMVVARFGLQIYSQVFSSIAHKHDPSPSEATCMMANKIEFSPAMPLPPVFDVQEQGIYDDDY